MVAVLVVLVLGSPAADLFLRGRRSDRAAHAAGAGVHRGHPDQAEGDYARVHAVGKRGYLVARSLTDLESRLDPERFARASTGRRS
jgi:hypothetical protein